MELEKQPLKQMQLSNLRYQQPPYSVMIEKLGDEGRLAIHVYEAALSIITKEHCLMKRDDMFMAKLNFDTQLGIPRLEKYMGILFEYGLFNYEFMQKTGYLSSAAFQQAFFEIKKNFRYEINTIPTKLLLIPLDLRKDMHLGLQVKTGAHNLVGDEALNSQMCQLYKEPDYKALFVETGLENAMQMIIQKRAFGMVKK